MKSIYKYLFILAWFTVAVTSCNFKEQVDPNRPGVDELVTKGQVNALTIGLLADIRNGLQIYRTASGTIARDLYLFDADPRNTQDLLGKNGGQLDNNSFYLNDWYEPYYRVVKDCNLLIAAVAKDIPGVNTTEVKGYTGFAKTMKAHVFIQVLNLLGSNGVRIEVADPANLGPFLKDAAAYTAIRSLLDEAATDLDAAGAVFGFGLHEGFKDFNTPANFKKFNRALAAKVALYQKSWADVLTQLGTSFYSETGDLNVGPQYNFSSSANDLLNPLFYGTGSDNIYAHPSFNQDAEAGDKRVATKTLAQVNTKDNLTATHRQNIYKSSADPVSIIRNEELILMAAEAHIQQNNATEAVRLINIVRTAAGLANYAGATDQATLITQLLKERRYSLWLEGVRMADLRRYNRLNAANLPIDRTGDIVHTEFPIPLSDSN
ncbi:RagB/SusD family nutrient uptake outer membrane protein [uncultured Microscilla sp.]|uniref:RagB/SusD family nutrient uptake outer membrane protein n=1 Tax=uncultured Microscilla sp. TaxID=432653 RepID=UPI0026139EAE|nr:RagB/SusD family nutrient uptake outer membrane protein [uncultured Microscilla sp.]